jgi:hypothetical protein
VTQLSVGDSRPVDSGSRRDGGDELLRRARRMLLLVTPFAAALGCTLFCALRSQPVQIPVNENLQHMAAFGALMVSGGAIARRPLPRAMLAAGLLLLGGAIEPLQALPSIHRDADIVDWMADAAGVGLGWVLLVTFWALRTRAA